MKLGGRTAFVTGAARGIGLAVARRLAEDGARVTLSDVDETEGAAAEAALRIEGLRTAFVACDVGQASSIATAVAAAEETFGPADILINNAAIHRSIDFLEMTEVDYSRIMQVNATSVFLLSQAVARRLVAMKRGGAIVNIASINARMSSARAVAYASSKGAVTAFTASISLALAEHGIRVNAIAPGSIETEMVGVARQDGTREETLRRIPIGRIGKPDEIAALAAFLASDDASYITGQTIFADGGRTALSLLMPRQSAASEQSAST